MGNKEQWLLDPFFPGPQNSLFFMPFKQWLVFSYQEWGKAMKFSWSDCWFWSLMMDELIS